MELTIVGEDEQSFGIKIKSADGFDPPLYALEEVSNGGSSEGIIEGRNTSPRFIQQEVYFWLKLTNQFPINPDMIPLGIGLKAKACNNRPVNLNPSLYDEFFGMTTGSKACLR